MAAAVALTDVTLAASLQDHSGLLVVDVWADWCAPCRALAPTIETLAAQYAGRAVVAKMVFDENPDAAARYGVRSIPTVLFFRDGEIVDRIVGAHPLPVFSQRIEQLLADRPINA